MKINTKLSALCIAAALMSVAQAAAAAPVVTAPAEATQPGVASPAAAAPAQVPAPAVSASVTTPAPAQAPSVPATSAPATAADSAKAATPAAPSAPAPRPASVTPAAAPSVPSTAKPSKPQQPSTSAPAAAAAASVKPTQLDKLNHESAIPLVLEAQSRYLYAISGGSSVGESFQWNGKSYRYLSEDIGTKTKLTSYLTQAYTKQASEQFVGKFFVEINGKLAQLDADGGNLLEFNRATAKMVTMTPVKRSYLLTVPYPAGTKQANEKITVNFEKVGSYWKISSAPHIIF
ncbi:MULTISPECIES: DL-endopeptidase inhibitor IseA family protein [unclassified Paenibacillus]|uniref:DL-endopeptidase inhibitor IseA family protein n=1 Tax=unclassified Paenibacillus TaxID=185978 RepID=UPI00384C0398